VLTMALLTMATYYLLLTTCYLLLTYLFRSREHQARLSEAGAECHLRLERDGVRAVGPAGGLTGWRVGGQAAVRGGGERRRRPGGGGRRSAGREHACSSRFAASRWRHCTWRIPGSCLKRTSSGGGVAGCVGGGVSASVTSLMVTVACCTNSHRPPRLRSSPNVAKSETRPEQDEVVT